ncbi:exodeoxyribonuclease VII small subunit [Pseudanabaena sp. FACHB-2040]|uniref:exodeoxyribonuclease VII small subunit n=1 Tax=Pseudanabaena sp. FACHB-2040 TaxID=2692859 RepID=UPI00168958A1|nr:exodeoxyribonuclease VII small subunit [Pseudanabaena sp. FACHB-2040]MBD2260110.1 exodeoxyribonuclease VII small subunit [Pseudanabaena sp. FACHB-2040]
MPAKSTRKSAPDDWNYEVAVSEVETLIAQLEAGELPLADVFTQFEKAVTVLQQCETYLTAKRQQVDLLIETLEEA